MLYKKCIGLRDLVKKSLLIKVLLQLLRGNQLKWNLRRIERRYEKRITALCVKYSEVYTITRFRLKHRKLCPYFSPKKKGHLNIFWVGANRSQDETGLLQALCNLGKVNIFHNNSEYNYGPVYTAPRLNWLQVRESNDRSLVRQVRAGNNERKIDLVLGQMWANFYSVDALKEIRRLGIPVINISMDDRLPELWGTRGGVRMGSVGLGQALDLVLTTCPKAKLWYEVENIPAIYFPLASDANLFNSNVEQRKDIDILFIGNCYGIRGTLISRLRKRGIAVDCYGVGWPNGQVDAQQNVSLTARAKIILGVGTIGYCSDVYTLKLRDFDAIMSGALYITHRNPDLLEIFEEGVHLECYKDLDELCLKLRYYLNNEEPRNKIGSQGRRYAKKHHTWDRRLQETFQKLGILQ